MLNPLEEESTAILKSSEGCHLELLLLIPAPLAVCSFFMEEEEDELASLSIRLEP